MRTICLFILTTIFSQTKAKVFLVTLDNEKGKELHDDSDIVEQDIEEEKANNDKEADEKEVEMPKEVEQKATTTDTVRDKTGHVVHSVASDYSSSYVKGKTGGTKRCRYKKNKR